MQKIWIIQRPILHLEKESDPYIHEAVHIEATDLVEENRVVSEVQRGYFLGEKLYRPARVVVSKGIASRVSHRDENWDDYDGETIGR